MTPYEYVDLSQSAFGNSISSYAVFLSIVTGYLVTAYLVGAKLTRTQVSILTILFLIVMVFMIWAVSAYVYWGIQFGDQASPETAGRSFMSPRPFVPGLLALVNLFTVAMCLFFMWNVRHPK